MPTITQIYCHNKGGDAIHDDMMILVQTDAGPPIRFPLFGSHPMQDGDDYYPGSVYYFSTTAYISLWDRDGALNFCDASDMLGATWVSSGNADTFVKVRGDQGAHYTIYYTITQQEEATFSEGSSLNSDLQKAISEDLLSWAKTSDGQEVIAKTNPSDLEDLLKAALLSKAFSNTAAQLQSMEKIKAISFGLMAQADIFLGIEGSFGVAINRSDFQFIGIDSDPDDVTASIFAGGGFVEGIEDGIEGTLAIGIWFEDAADIGGFYVGEEVDVADGVGVTAAAFAGKDDKDEFKNEEGEVQLEKAKVIFLGIDVGIDDGTEADEIYFFSGTMSNMPVSQSGDYNHMAVLDDLHCKDALSSDANSKDHVYIEYTVDDDSTVYRYPIWNTFEMAENDLDHWYCGNAIKFNTKFNVKLYVGTGSANGSQMLVDQMDYTIDQFNVNSNVDNHFKGSEGIHDIDYHLHAIKLY